MTKLHILRKKRKDGVRWYVYAWRGGPQIHVQDGARPVITPEILDKQHEARQSSAPDYARSFEALLDQYLASPEFDRLADVTKDDYRRWIVRISERFGSAPLSIMSDYRMKKDVLAWRDKWANHPRAADRAVGTLSVVLAWAARRGMIAGNIAADLGTLYRVDRSDDVWEERHWDAVRDVPPHVLRVLRFGRLTGLRMGDLLRLSWDDVGQNAIVIHTSKSRKKVRATIPLYADLKAALEEIEGRTGPILRNSRGKPWTTSGFKSSWGTAMPEGFDRHFHDLRGTCATWLAGLDFTDNAIAGILGWQSSRVSEIRARYVNSHRTVIELAEKMSR